MCYHRRLLFACAHYAWLNLTRACAVEASFCRGEADVGCAVKWSHGFDTIRVQRHCPRCVAARTDDDFRLGVVKEQIQVLKEQLRLIKEVAALEAAREDVDGAEEKRDEKTDARGDEKEGSLCEAVTSSAGRTRDTSVVGEGCPEKGSDPAQFLEEVRN
ncbi:hypothetical protein VTI74DRAFT_7216 [Chaetomium olivicolor]